jgi:hypothetical protein
MRYALIALLVCACGQSRIPEAVQGYDVIVAGSDSLSVELARALREYGIRVRPRVRGGSGPAAALIFFTFRDPQPGQPTWLHLRLADTRSGVIIRAGTIPLDSTISTVRARANAGVQALMTGDSTLPSP